MMEKSETEKILRRFISPPARILISRFLNSSWINNKPLYERNVSFLRKDGEGFRWGMPSSGSAHIDLALGEEMAIDFMYYATTFNDSHGYERNAYPYDLVSMIEKMKAAADAENYALGFQMTLFRFLGYALHHPERYRKVMERLAELSLRKIDDRIEMILSGSYPPDLLAF